MAIGHPAFCGLSAMVKMAGRTAVSVIHTLRTLPARIYPLLFLVERREAMDAQPSALLLNFTIARIP
jgi:hypothetical protein